MVIMVSHPMKLGSYEFPSKKEAKEYIRGVLDRNRNTGEALEGEELEATLDLLEYHPNYEEKFWVGIKSIYVKGSENNRCFNIDYIDGSEDGHFGIDKCFHGSSKTLARNRRQKAYRMAVKDQTDKYKEEHRYERCAKCGCSTLEEAHVDHEEPQFAELIRQFEQDRSYLPIEFDEGQNHTKIFREGNPKDAKFAGDWREFHKKNAKLRVLCPKCNLTRNRLIANE